MLIWQIQLSIITMAVSQVDRAKINLLGIGAHFAILATPKKIPRFLQKSSKCQVTAGGPERQLVGPPANITQSSRPKLILQCSQENRRFFFGFAAASGLKSPSHQASFTIADLVNSKTLLWLLRARRQLLLLIIVSFCLFVKRATIRSWSSRITALFQAQDSDMLQNLLTVGASATLNTATFFFFFFFFLYSLASALIASKPSWSTP
jgi:preprotein translocase subunit SecG